MSALRAYVPCHHENDGWPWFNTFEFSLTTRIVVPAGGMFPTSAPSPQRAANPTPLNDGSSPLVVIRDIDLAILEAAPAPTAPPITIKRLARLSGYSYTGYFRDAVNGLVDAGQLLRTRQGVRRARTA